MLSRQTAIVCAVILSASFGLLASPIVRPPIAQPQLRESLSITDVQAVHQMGFTGKGIEILVVDFFGAAREYHGQLVSEVLRTVAPDVTIVPLELDEIEDLFAFAKKLEKLLRAHPHIRVANFSWGFVWEEKDVTFDGYCTQWVETNDLAVYELVRDLVARGVVLVGAAGNGGIWQGISAPACMREFISVGASYDQDLENFVECGGIAGSEEPRADHVACFSNSAQILDLLAPGYLISLPKENVAGTSFAAPFVSGIAALLLEAAPKLKSAEIRDLLRSTGKPIKDERNGAVIPRVDALAAMRRLLHAYGNNEPPPSAKIPAQLFDQDHNRLLGDLEVLAALEAWMQRRVLSALARSLSDLEMLELISLWARGALIEENN